MKRNYRKEIIQKAKSAETESLYINATVKSLEEAYVELHAAKRLLKTSGAYLNNLKELEQLIHILSNQITRLKADIAKNTPRKPSDKNLGEPFEK